MTRAAEPLIIDSIIRAVKDNKYKPIVLRLGGLYFTEIVGAFPYTGSLYKTNVPYTDFILDKRNTKGINIAFDTVVFSEEVQQLELIVPGLRYKFVQAVIRKIKELKIEVGQELPEFYGKIGERYKNMLFRGTLALGGPVQYVLTGTPKTFSYDYDEDTATLTIPGSLTSIDKYAKEYEVYLKLEPLYHDQKYDPTIQRGGIQLIYGKSETRGEGGSKITIASEVPKTGTVVNIE